MKVPTYRQQTARTEKTGATMFSVQANPGALSAGLRATADLFSSAESLAVNYYAEEQKIKRQSELDDAEFELKQELQQLEQQQKTRKPNDVLFSQPNKGTQNFADLGQQKINDILANISDKRVRRAFQQSARDSLNTFTINVNQDSRNRLIDQNKANGFRKANELIDDAVMGNGAARAKALLQLYGDPSTNKLGHYEQMAADGYIKETEAVTYRRDAQQKILERNQKAGKAILEKDNHKRVAIASDTSRPITERNNAYNTAVAEINKAAETGIIDVAEAEKQKENLADDTIRTTILSIMSESSDASAAVMSITDSRLDPALADEYPVLGSILTQTDQGTVTKILDDMLIVGRRIDTERRENEEREEASKNQALDRDYQTILNVDKDNPDAVAAAKTLHKNLLEKNYYDKAATRKAAEDILGLSSDNGRSSAFPKESNDKTLGTLFGLDAQNMLTLDVVNAAKDAGELSLTDYKYFSNKAIDEGIAGLKKAKEIISNKLRYNEYKDDTGALGEGAREMYYRSVGELDAWANQNRGATYQQTLAKAKEINRQNDEEFKGIMREALLSYLQTSFVLQGLGFDAATIDQQNPGQSALQFLSTVPVDPRTERPKAEVTAATLQIKSYRKIAGLN